MSCSLRPPPIVARDAGAIERDLAAHRRGYVPRWDAAHDSASALNSVFARQLEVQGAGLNAMPLRLQLEFLDSTGSNVLPAQPARAPLVFTLLETASGDATVAAGTRVAAVLPPPAPSLASDHPTVPVSPPEFFTEQAITAMRGTLAALYSIDPQADTYADHSGGTPGNFAVFDTSQAVPHRIYLGHGEVLKLTGSAQIVLTLMFGPTQPTEGIGAGQRPLLLDWEYLSADGWQPLQRAEDKTSRFTRDGTITLDKLCGPDSKEDFVDGLGSYWIRATVSSRVPAARIVQDALTLDEAQHFVARIENGLDLLVGDVVTLDGNTRATVLGITETSLTLDAPIGPALRGEYIALADALPPLRPEGADQAGALPQVDVIRAVVGLEVSDLPIGSAYLDGFAIDISKDFYPFGQQPQLFAAFYVSCKDAFTRSGARIELHFTFSVLYDEYQDGTATPPTLRTEYFDGSRWLALGSQDELIDGTVSLTQGTGQGDLDGVISFVAPAGWMPTSINGDNQQWLRLRLLEGDYGQPLSLSVQADPGDNSKSIVVSTPSTLRPPIVSLLSVSYEYFTLPQALDHCVTENDFAYTDHSEDARWPRRPFTPFTPVSDVSPALHLGFSARPPASLISLLVHVIEPAAEGDPLPLVWDYWSSRGWSGLSVRDTTGGLGHTGLVQFVGAPDALPREGLGGALYRIRARLKDGLTSQAQMFRCGGIWLNAVWASQGQRVDREQLGISNGNPQQTYALPMARAVQTLPTPGVAAAMESSGDFERALDIPLAGVPVLAGEVVEVREWSGRGDDWQTTLADVDSADLRFEVDAQDSSVQTAAWVRWHPQPHFFGSGPDDRHYVVERACGVFGFPGAAGYIPPAGCPIVVSYVTGGGVAGNVGAGAIRELRSSVGFIQSVGNPLAAGGGAAAELLRAARNRGLQAIRHRQRAVSVEDYEWLALGASSEVARARALPLEGPDGRGSCGYVGLVLVPQSLDAQPMPSLQLRDTVLSALRRSMPAGVGDGLRSLTPSYVPVGVRADVLPRASEDPGTVEARIRASLTRFLHPLSGGREGRGWEFGASVYLSDLAALIAAIDGVDAVQSLQMTVGQTLYTDRIPAAPHQLVSAGDLQLKIIVPSAPYALA